MNVNHREKLQRISLTSLWDVPLQTHGGGQPHCTGGDVEVSRSSVQRAEQSPHPELQFQSHFVLCPPGTRGLRIALGRRISHVSLRGSILVFRVAGVPVRRRPDTGQVTFWGALLLQRRFASLQQTWLEMVACSTERRRSEVGARSCPVCMRACVHGWGGSVGIGYFLFITFLSFDQMRAPSTASSAGSSALRLSRTSFWIFHLTQEGIFRYAVVTLSCSPGMSFRRGLSPRGLRLTLKTHLITRVSCHSPVRCCHGTSCERMLYSKPQSKALMWHQRR